MEPATDIEIRPGWRMDDAQLQADAIDFWKRVGNLPAGIDPEARAKELVLGAYKDGRLIGVQTAEIVTLDFLRARFALVRASVDPEARRSHAAVTMAFATRDHLQSWAAAHPEERLAGFAAVLESPQLTETERSPVWRGTRLVLTRHTREGRQIRVSWFPHYRLEPPDASEPRPRIDPPTDVEVRPGWRRNDPELEADAIAYWQRLNYLPAGADPAVRAKQLIGGCYRDGKLIGVATAEIVHLDFVRARFAMLRISVDPEAQRSRAATALTYYARNTLDRWSEAHPEERLAGIGVIIEARDIGPLLLEPFWPESGLGLVGYTPEGQQVRLSWFLHYRLG